MERERNVLFNDTLNTFYLRLYDVRHMVKDHSDSEKGNPLPPHRLFLLINSYGFFYMHHPTDRIAHTTAFVTPVVEHKLKREIAQWVHPMKDRSDDPPHHERTLYLRATSRSCYYGVRHMVKNHSDRERGNLLPPHRLLFFISSKVFLDASSHRQDNTYHSLYYASRGTRNSSMGPPHEGSIRRPIASWANALTTELHLAPGHSDLDLVL